MGGEAAVRADLERERERERSHKAMTQAQRGNKRGTQKGSDRGTERGNERGNGRGNDRDKLRVGGWMSMGVSMDPLQWRFNGIVDEAVRLRDLDKAAEKRVRRSEKR